jgi:murein DD-endopeptidase MepM/ murein hydrolase activator NlpD
MLKETTGKIWAKFVKKYRLVLYDHESLSQKRNFVLRPATIIIAMSLFSIATVAGTTLLIFKVPAIHQNISGFKKPQLTEDYKLLQDKNNDLEKRVEEMDSLLASFTRVAGMNNPTPSDRAIWEAAAPEPGPNVAADTVRAQPAGQELTLPALPEDIRAPLRQKDDVPPSSINLIKPVDGFVTMNFDTEEKDHYGIDLVANENALIRSVADGVVIFSEYSNTTGYVVGIWHDQYNLISFYKHNSRLFKTVGSYVFAGEAIAVIGNTGINSSGMHLHFELWHNNNPVNPADYLDLN